MERRKSRSPKRYVYGAKDSFKKKRSPKKRSRSRRNKSLRPKRSHRHRSRSNASNKKMIRKSRSPKRHVYSSHKKKSGPKRSSRHRSRRLRSNRVSRRGVSRRVSRRLSEYSPKNRSKFSYVSSLKSKISPRSTNVKKRVGLRLRSIIDFIKKIGRKLFRNKSGNKNNIVDNSCKKIFKKTGVKNMNELNNYIKKAIGSGVDINKSLEMLTKDLIGCLEKYTLPGHDIHNVVLKLHKNNLDERIKKLLGEIESNEHILADEQKGILDIAEAAKREKEKNRLINLVATAKQLGKKSIKIGRESWPIENVEKRIKKLGKRETELTERGTKKVSKNKDVTKAGLESTKELQDKLDKLLKILKKYD